MSEDDDYLPSIGGGAPLSPAPKEQAPPTADVEVTLEQPGRYERRDEIGRGGIGRVWLGFDRHIGREVAIKELLDAQAQITTQESGGSSVYASRFLREARVTGRLEHPAIVPVYELGQRGDGSLYYTMKVVRGQTLAQALAACHDLDDRLDLLQHFGNLCNAIAYAHAKGVIHRDIKPANVMVGDYGETVVLDWGLAKVLTEEGERDRGASKLRSMAAVESGGTLDGHALGTPAYMSPEQAAGEIEKIDARSDVWGLGAVLYEILTGHPPYEGETPYEIVGKVMAEDPRPITEFAPQVPRELAAVAQKALRRSPDERYPRAADVADEVEAYRSGRRVEAHRYTAFELLRRLVQQHRSAVVVGAVAVLAAIIMAIVAYAQVANERDRALAIQRQSQGHLAQGLYEKAKLAVERKDWIEAEVLTASALQIVSALGQHDAWPELRGLLLSLEDRWRPQLSWLRTFGWSCSHMKFSPDGKTLTCPTLSGVALLRVEDGEESGRFVGGDGYVRDAVWSDDGSALAAIGFDGVLRVWRVPVRDPVAEVRAHRNEAFALARRGELLVTGGADRNVVAWSWSGTTPTERWRDRVHEDSVTAVAVGPAGQWVASGDVHGHVVVRDASGTVVQRLRPHRNRVVALEVLEGLQVASASSDRRVVVSSIETGDELTELGEHEGGVSALYASRRAPVLATGDERGTVRFWSLRQQRLLGRFTTHAGEVLSVDFHGESRRLLTASDDGVVRLWDVGERAAPSELLGADDDLRAVTWSSDGTRVAAGGRSGRVTIWDRTSGDIERIAEVGVREVRAVSFDSTGALLAAAPENESPAWFDVRIAEGPFDPRAAAHFVVGAPPGARAVRFFPHRYWLVSGADDGAVRLHNLENNEARELGRHAAVVSAVDVSPGGTRIASGGFDHRVKLWDTTSAELSATLEGHDGNVTAVTFLDDARLASLSVNGELVLWSTAGERLAAWRAHEGPGRAIDAASDGTLLATSGLDHRVRIWSATDGELLAELDTNDTVYSLAFSPEGYELATVADGDRVSLLSTARINAPVDALLERAKRKFGVTVEGVDLVPQTEPTSQ